MLFNVFKHLFLIYNYELIDYMRFVNYSIK